MTQKEKVKIYERLLHNISYAVTAGNNERVRELVSLIDSWSYAHRSGNGELSDREQRTRVLLALRRLEDASL
jgi:hypothetical protein